MAAAVLPFDGYDGQPIIILLGRPTAEHLTSHHILTIGLSLEVILQLTLSKRQCKNMVLN